MTRLVLGLIAFYKAAISPAIPSACKYYPTCSEYAADAVRKHGAAKGLWMGLRRFVRCRPFHAGGYDPVV